MAEFFPPVIFEIKARATEAIATFGMVNKELEKMQKNGELASGKMAGLQKASKYAGAALMGLAGTFAVFAAASVRETLRVEDAQVRLETAVKNSGVSFEVAKPAIDQQTSALNSLGFSTEDVYTALAKMTAATRDPQLALKSLGAAADLARFKNIDLATAGTIVARASVGQARGLSDLGLAINKTIPKGASFAEIMKLIEDRTKNAAYTFSKTTTGSLLIAQAQFKNLENQLGQQLLPILNKVLKWFNTDGIKGIKGFFNFVKDNKGLVVGLVSSLAALWAVGKVLAFIEVIKKLITAFKALRDAAIIADLAEMGPVGLTILAALGVGIGAYSLGKLLGGKRVDTTGGQVGVGGSRLGIRPNYGTPDSRITITKRTSGYTPYIPTVSLDDPRLKGVGNPLIKSTKTTKAKKQSIRQQEAGIISESNGKLHITISTDSSATVKSITGAGGNTKVMKK